MTTTGATTTITLPSVTIPFALPEELPTLPLDRDQARSLVGGLSVALGSAAVLLPSTTAGALGIKSRGGALPLLVRMIGVRNVVMGLRTLQAEDEGDRDRALAAGLSVGVVDTVAVLAAARSGVLGKRAAASVLLLLGALAVAGIAAGQD